VKQKIIHANLRFQDDGVEANATMQGLTLAVKVCGLAAVDHTTKADGLQSMLAMGNSSFNAFSGQSSTEDFTSC